MPQEDAGVLHMHSKPEALSLIVGPVYDRHRINLLADGLPDGLDMGTGNAHRLAKAHTGGEEDGLGAAINEHLGPGHGPFAGTAATGHKAYDFGTA